MADQHPQDQPKPVPGEAQRDWNQVSAEEIEQTLTNAADLAYELAGDMGVTPDQPRFRDASELQAIESALDSELKQIDHLVNRTREELGDSANPANQAGTDPAASPGSEKPTLSVPDFMAEFMSDEPVTIFPAGGGASPNSGAAQSVDDTPTSLDAQLIPGLVGVGTLGHRNKKKPPKTQRQASPNPDAPPRESFWAKMLGKPAYRLCQGVVTMLEILDRPLTKLNPQSRRALHVTALAAFCVCLMMFVLSLLFS